MEAAYLTPPFHPPPLTPPPSDHPFSSQSGDELHAMEAAYPDRFKLFMALSLERKNRKGGLEYVQVRVAAIGDCMCSWCTAGLWFRYLSMCRCLR